jgi:phytoene synthase
MDPLAWCRERILVPGNPLTASLLFADPDHRDSILVLRTLVSEIGAAIGSEDQGVARTRLAWWREAVAGTQPAAQRHPVMAAMQAVGMASRIESAGLLELIESIELLLENPRHESRDELWALCRRIGGQSLALEACLLGGDQGVAAHLAEIGASAYLIRMTRDLAMDAAANRWWVPLDLQAEYQLSRADVVERKSGRALDGLIRTLVHDAMKRAQDAVSSLEADDRWVHRHALVHWSLDRRLGARIDRRPAQVLERRILPSHSGNVWTAWRCARRVRKGRFP